MTPTNNEQQEPRKGPQSGTPGALLRQAREAGGHTQATVADALHLTVHYIKSLENDDYSKLPGLIFVKGYMRSYARFLKIDVDNLMACYDAHLGALPEVKSQTLAGNYTRKRNDQAIGWAIAAALVVLMGLGAGWWFFGRQEPELAAPRVSTPSTVEQANRSSPAARLNTVPATSTAAPTQTYSATAQGAVGSNTDTTLPDASGTTFQPGQTNGALNGALQGEPLVGTVLPTLPTADVVSGAATILPAAAGQDSVIVAVAPEPVVVDPLAQAAEAKPAAGLSASRSVTTITPTPAGGRQINLLGAGADQMQLTFSGNSWVEIDDGRNVRLYNEMLLSGDTLLVQGQAPFHVLFGDGRNVTVTFNSSPIDISSSVRSDSTSRITLSNPATLSVPLESAGASTASGDAATGIAPTATPASTSAATSATSTPAGTGNAGATP